MILYQNFTNYFKRIGYFAVLGVPINGKLPCQKKPQDRKVKFEETKKEKDRGNWLPGIILNFYLNLTYSLYRNFEIRRKCGSC